MHKLFFYISSLIACSILALSTGCASGGFKLTRQYARWVNSQMIILRIILYIVTIPIYGITMLVDLVIFNTMDFWNGTVAAGAYQFDQDGKKYFVNHEFQPGTVLKQSTIVTKDNQLNLLQTVVLKETAVGEIELFVDGKLRTKVTDLSSFPIATIFDINGTAVKEQGVLTSMSLDSTSYLARH